MSAPSDPTPEGAAAEVHAPKASAAIAANGASLRTLNMGALVAAGPLARIDPSQCRQ